MSDQSVPSPDDPDAVDAAAGVRHRILGTVMPVQLAGFQLSIEALLEIIRVAAEPNQLIWL